MSEQYKVAYSSAALQDLKDIYAYIAFELLAPDAAKAQLDRIRAKIRALEQLPLRHAAVDWEPWQGMGMRQVPIDRFIAFYTVQAGNVTIIRVVYGGRDLFRLAKEPLP